MNPHNEKLPFGCLHYVIAYCLACYAISAFAFGQGFSFPWILIAPVAVPAWFSFVLFWILFLNNSEAGYYPSELFVPLANFLVLFAAATQVVRQCFLRRWVAFCTGTALILYLVFAAYWCAGAH